MGIKPSVEQQKDTGVVFGLVLILAGILTNDLLWTKIALGIILAALIIPKAFRVPAVLWFGLSEKLGFIVSNIILGLIYLALVVPVSFLRKLFKKDGMMIKNFKKRKGGYWSVRDHEYKAGDFQKPF